MAKFLNLFKSKSLQKAEAIRNPWGLARYLAEKYRGVPGEIPYKELKPAQQRRIKEFMGAVGNPGVQNRTGKANRVMVDSEGNPGGEHHSQGQGTGTPKGVKASTGSKNYRKHKQIQDPEKKAAKEAATTKANKAQIAAWREKNPDEYKKLQAQRAERAQKKSSNHVTQFITFLSEGNITALNKILLEVDDSPEGLFMQAVRKAMGIHSEQYKDVGKPQFLKKAQTTSKPLQKISSNLVAFLAGLGLSDEIVRSGGGSPRGEMTAAQQREWERMINRQMKRKSLKDGVTMEDLQKHWSDSSDTYVRRAPVPKGVQAGETFLDKRLPAPPRPGEVWNPVSHRWTKEGNLGKVNVGSGGKKRLRAGSSAAGAHQRSVGGLSGKGRLRHIGTGRVHRTTVDVAEQAQGTKAGVGSAKGPTSPFRTGAKSRIKVPTNRTGSGSLRHTPTRKSKRKPKSRISGKHSNLNVSQN